MATFVLVHGAMVGGWCWRWVTPFLRENGHDVYTPTLTGLGERVHLVRHDTSLQTHIDDVRNLLQYEDLADVILVGWSYGGMVVAGVADRARERVRHLVFLDSDVPSDADTSVPPSQHTAREALAREHGDGWLVPPGATRVESLLLGGLPPAQREWIAARLVAQPLATWLQPIRLTGAAAPVPTTYVRCLLGYDPADEDTRRQDDRIRSEPGWRYLELNESHAAPFTAPGAVASVLLEIVRPYQASGNQAI